MVDAHSARRYGASITARALVVPKSGGGGEHRPGEPIRSNVYSNFHAQDPLATRLARLAGTSESCSEPNGVCSIRSRSVVGGPGGRDPAILRLRQRPRSPCPTGHAHDRSVVRPKRALRATAVVQSDDLFAGRSASAIQNQGDGCALPRRHSPTQPTLRGVEAPECAIP